MHTSCGGLEGVQSPGAAPATTSALPQYSTGRSGPRPVGPVVVGVDGSLGGLKAVSWAAAEAARCGAALELVHVARAGDEPIGRRRAALHRALGAAAAVAPRVAMNMVREPGAAGRGLLAQAAHASLLVVGGRRRPACGPSGDRTVADLLGHAPCPVVVVPPRRTGTWASTPSARPVLVGFTEDTDAAAVENILELGLDAARRRGVSLVVWSEENPASDQRGLEALAHRARAGGAQRFETTMDLASALRDVGQRAQLIVLGPQPAPCANTPAHSPLRVDDLVGLSPCAVMVASPQAASGRGHRIPGMGAEPVAAVLDAVEPSRSSTALTARPHHRRSTS